MESKNFCKVTAASRSRNLFISESQAGKTSSFNLPQIAKTTKNKIGLSYLKQSGDLKNYRSKKRFDQY